jgi:maleylacetate reductase
MSSGTSSVQAGIFHIQALERVIFGTPAGKAVLEEADRAGAQRVFVTSTRSLAAKTDGPLQRVVAALGERCVGTFSTIRAHSPREDIIAGANAARAVGADLLVAVGGGSVIDATKAMLLCMWMGLESADAMEPYLSTNRTAPAGMRLPEDPIRMVAISTTLSASEFTPHAGITDSRTNTKQTITHRLQVPRAVILDPAATLDTPDWLLFCTGIRALDHAVESYCSLVASPATEGLSLDGLRLLSRSLPRIKADPTDLAARMEAQFGMWQAQAASVSGTGTGASHGIGYALGSTYGVAHGHTSCVMLPAVLTWNAKVNGERQKALSQAMGRPDRPAGELVAGLVAGLDLPGNLRAVGIKPENLDDIAERALGYPQVTKLNPRPVRNVADVKEILQLAW